VCAPEEDQPKGKNKKFFSFSICPSSEGSSKKEKKKKKNHSWQAFHPTEDHLFAQEDNRKSRKKKKKIDKSTRRLRF
jgi:hypothetical protein